MPRPALLLPGVVVVVVAALGLSGPGPLPDRAAPPPSVLLLGDSLTWGQTGATTALPGGFRAPLHDLLTAAGVPHRFTGSRRDNAAPSLLSAGQDAHEGWPGHRVDEDLVLLPAVPPDAAVVLLGTNDLVQRFDPSGGYPSRDGRADPADPAQAERFATALAGRVAELLERLAPARVVLVAPPPHLRPGQAGPDALAVAYDRALRALAAQAQADGRPVVLADAWTPFRSGPGLLSSDGVHPTEEGYRVLARVLAPALQQALSAGRDAGPAR